MALNVAQLATSLEVAQQGRPSFTFYATFDSDSECSWIPEGTSILLPASSYARAGMRKPRLPAHIVDVAADCGGFVASRVWGEYRYTLEQYVIWLRSFAPMWAATMDYCCEPELERVTRERQEQTTANAWQAWQCFKSESWVWTPTIQGYTPDDYRRHAHALKPLIAEMQAFYTGKPFRVGVGTLCNRNDVVAVQAVVNAVREVLPDTPLHLWGIKLDALKSISLDNVVSSDSAVWSQTMYASRDIAEKARLAGMSARKYRVTVNLPSYAEKVQNAVRESRLVASSQKDLALVEQARSVLKAQGWTINIRTRRNRQYVYGARRVGKRVEQVSICPVSKLAEWLVSQSSA